MRLSKVLFLTLILGTFVSLGAQAASPQVVSTVPELADGYVDSNLSEISVTFDQSMNTSSYSWVTLGSNFPEIAGNPKWVDSTTCVLPVNLEPAKNYLLCINSPGQSGFQSNRGEPAVPYLLAFSTSGGDSEGLSEDQKQRNQKSFEELSEIIKTYYSYKDRLNLDWEAIFASEKDEFLKAANDFIFAAQITELLKPAQDPHMFVRVGQQSLPTFWRMHKTNYNLQALFSQLTNAKRWSNSVISGEAGAIGYIVVGGWVPDAATATEAINKLRDKKAIIIDVRPNSGGNEMIAQEVAGCFTDQPVTYAKSLYFDPETKGFTRLSTRELQPNSNYETYRGKVFVLTGPQVMSSNEAFLLMMKEIGATLVGEPSYGSSGNPKPYELTNGLTVFVPQWKAMDADGYQFEGKGIEPDALLEFSQEEFAAADPLFQKAMEIVEQTVN